MSTTPHITFVVIYGPPGSGKTVNKEALRLHYRCSAVIDDGDRIQRWQLRGLKGRVLVISSGTGLRDPFDRRRVLECRYIRVDAAAKALGANWVKPRDSGFRLTTIRKVTGTEAGVCGDIALRQAHGITKYGTTVADNPLTLRQWLQHAYEETLDQAVYLKRAIEEMEKPSK